MTANRPAVSPESTEDKENASMKSIRPLELDSPAALRPRGYRSQVLYSGESCVIIATKVPPGGHAFPRHVHGADQIYFVLEGRVNVDHGKETTSADAGSAVFIPAGLPHHNWNDGITDESHLEIIAPGGAPGKPIAELVDSTDSDGLTVLVCEQDEAKRRSAEKTTDWILTRQQGSAHAIVNVSKTSPGRGGPSLHIHEFDQFFLVLEGILQVEIGLSAHTVPAGNLVVLPAGVPHRQWNGGEGIERHLAILAPPPVNPHTPGDPWDVLVSLERLSS
jgi:quercetin dioxygenase-like cupin family protein